MGHVLAKTIIISKVVELIAQEYKIPLNDARDIFYSSDTIKLLDDDESGLYGESPLYVLSVFEQEQKAKKSI